jgi:hypothetical protein
MQFALGGVKSANSNAVVKSVMSILSISEFTYYTSSSGLHSGYLVSLFRRAGSITLPLTVHGLNKQDECRLLKLLSH